MQGKEAELQQEIPALMAPHEFPGRLQDFERLGARKIQEQIIDRGVDNIDQDPGGLADQEGDGPGGVIGDHGFIRWKICIKIPDFDRDGRKGTQHIQKGHDGLEDDGRIGIFPEAAEQAPDAGRLSEGQIQKNGREADFQQALQDGCQIEQGQADQQKGGQTVKPGNIGQELQGVDHQTVDQDGPDRQAQVAQQGFPGLCPERFVAFHINRILSRAQKP